MSTEKLVAVPQTGVGFLDRVSGQCANPLWAVAIPALADLRCCGEPCRKVSYGFGRSRLSEYCVQCSRINYMPSRRNVR